MRFTLAPYLLASVCGLTALGGCETVQEEVNEAIGFEYVAMLSPMSGGSGSGKAEVSLNDATNMICTDLELSSGVAMTAGHLVGPGDTTLATLEVPGNSDSGNDSADCDTVSDTVIDAIKANPGAYRIHIAASTGDLIGTLRKEG